MPDSVHALPPSAQRYAAPEDDVYALPVRRPSGQNAQGEDYWIDPDPGAAGYAMERQIPLLPPRSFGETVNDIAGFLDLGARGLTLGAWPHINAAITGGIPGIFTEEGFGGGYQSRLEEMNANMERVQEHSPTTAAAFEMGGAMLPAALTAGAGAPLAAPTVLGRIGQGATLGLGGGALYGYLEGDAPLLDPSRAENAIDYAKWGAGLGAALPAAFEAAPALRRAARTVLPSRTASRAADFSEEALRNQAAEFRTEARQLYDELDASGVRIDRQSIDDELLNFMALNEEGLIETPGADRFLSNLINRVARHGELEGGVPLGTLERWRQELNRKINDAWGQSRGEEAQMYELLQDTVDQLIMAHSDGAQREMWTYTMRFDALANAATRAADNATGNVTYEEALRRQLRSLKNRDRDWNLFSPEQQAAITEAVRSPTNLGGINGLVTRILGGGLQRTLSNTLGIGGALASGNPLFAAPALISAAGQSANARTLNRHLQDVARAMNPNAQPPLLPQLNIPLAAFANVPAIAHGYTGGGF